MTTPGVHPHSRTTLTRETQVSAPTAFSFLSCLPLLHQHTDSLPAGEVYSCQVAAVLDREKGSRERERTHPQVLPTEDQAAAWGGTEFQLGGESHSITHEPVSVDISVETSRAPSRESLVVESKPPTGNSTAVSHSLRSLFARTWIQQVISSSFSGLLHRLVCVPQSRSKPALSTLSASFSTASVEP